MFYVCEEIISKYKFHDIRKLTKLNSFVDSCALIIITNNNVKINEYILSVAVR